MLLPDSAELPGRQLDRSEQPRPVDQQHQQGHEAGKNVVKHDPQPAADPAVGPADRPGLPDIEQAKQQEPGQQPAPAGRRQPQGDPYADKFVPDDAAMVVYAQVRRRAVTQPDAEQGAENQNKGITAGRQLLPQQHERQPDQRAPG